MQNYSRKLRVIKRVRLWTLINTSPNRSRNEAVQPDLTWTWAWTFENAWTNKRIVDEGDDSWIPNFALRFRSLLQIELSIGQANGWDYWRASLCNLLDVTRSLHLLTTDSYTSQARAPFGILFAAALCHARSFLHILAAFGDRKASSLPSNDSNESFRSASVCPVSGAKCEAIIAPIEL